MILYRHSMRERKLSYHNHKNKLPLVKSRLDTTRKNNLITVAYKIIPLDRCFLERKLHRGI